MDGLTRVTVPDIGDFKNVPVIEILVKVGDRVVKDTPLVVLESDKATLDIPSPAAGLVKELKVALGDRVNVGSMLLMLGEPLIDANPLDDSIVAVPALEIPSPSIPLPSRGVPAIKSDLKQPVATGTTSLARSPYASPSIRRMCRELGIEVAGLRGSGPRGRVVKEDVQRFVKNSVQKKTEGGAITHTAPWPLVDFEKYGPIERVALSNLRRLSGQNLSRNAVVIPHVTNFEEADITDLESFRKSVNQDTDLAVPITLLAFLLKTSASALLKHPHFNASLDEGELILKKYVHIGFAVDTAEGLVVPVIRSVDSKSIGQIAQEVITIGDRAREGKLKTTDMQGGCFTVSSLGKLGGVGFTPIINAPEVGILGVTRAQIRPVWNGSEFRPRLILPLALSWDHRAVDGVAAARFLTTLASLLADLRRVVL